MNLLKTHYNSVVLADSLLLNPQLQFKKLPSCTCISLSANFQDGIGSALSVLELLGLRKAIFTNSKINSLSLRLKKGEVVGCKLDLRKDAMYIFLERLVFEILPSIKNITSYTVNSLQKTSFHMHIPDVFVLESINNYYMQLQGLRSLDIVFQTKHGDAHFFRSLRLPVKN